MDEPTRQERIEALIAARRAEAEADREMPHEPLVRLIRLGPLLLTPEQIAELIEQERGE